MGKPAARIMDATAHGGMVTGPGCATVLIGKMPAVRMTDLHVCPMCTGPIPHVGGPLVGPVPPTVFIGKLPAACVGDMCICTGPPSTVLPPGCPTVLIGSSGGAGAPGGSAAATAARAANTMGVRAPQPVEGTEAFPVELQRQLAEAARYQSPRETAVLVGPVADSLNGGSPDAPADEAELTIENIVEILKAVEDEEGYEAARHFASHLDYAKLTSMAMSGTEGNDPNRMPTRFMLLYGADDDKLREIDAHPDAFGDGDEHAVTVANLRRALRLLGPDIAQEGPYDEEVLQAHAAYLSSAWPGVHASPGTHVVERGDTLAGIAEVYGLVSWRYLYEVNRERIGANPDLLKPGTELTVPSWSHTNGEERLVAKGGKPVVYTGGLRYAYPWVRFSVTMVDGRGEVYREEDADGRMSDEFEQEKEFIVTDGDSGRELARGTTRRADGIAVLVPDAQRKVLTIDGRRFG